MEDGRPLGARSLAPADKGLGDALEQGLLFGCVRVETGQVRIVGELGCDSFEAADMLFGLPNLVQHPDLLLAGQLLASLLGQRPNGQYRFLQAENLFPLRGHRSL